MGTTGPRRGRLALVVGAAAALLTLAGVGPAAAQALDCLLDPSHPDCTTITTTTTVEDTTTTEGVETTTTEVTSTTEAPEVTRAPGTTVPQVVVTREAEEEPATTALDVTTSADLLVPGDGTEGAESTTTTTTTIAPLASDGDDGLSDGTLIALVIGGLVTVAVLVAILTWRYWVATRPVPVDHSER